MITKTFEYFRPTSINEALSILAENRDRNTKLLAGGQSLIPIMKLGLVNPDVVIDLKGIQQLHGIRMEDNELRIGALTRHVDIVRSEMIQRVCPVLQSAAKGIGHYLIRTRGTVGGSVMHCDPRADYLTVLFALDAKFIAKRLSGERTISISQFIKGPFETTLTNDEILTELVIPRPDNRAVEVYDKFELGHGDFGLVFVALRIWIDFLKCTRSVILVSGIQDFPIRLTDLELNLQSKSYDEINFDVIGSSLVGLGFDRDQSEMSFKKKLLEILLKRSIVQAFIQKEQR